MSSIMTEPAACASLSSGKERDTESGLDYFGARYYGSNMGRWMSPDWADKPEPVPYSSLDNPQSLNLYGYVLNNPLSKDDPDGHCCEWAKQKYAQAQKWTGDHPRTVAAMKATGAAIVTVAAVATIVATAPVSVPVTFGAAAASALTTTAVAITGTGAAVATVAYTGAAITGDQNLGGWPTSARPPTSLGAPCLDSETWVTISPCCGWPRIEYQTVWCPIPRDKWEFMPVINPRICLVTRQTAICSSSMTASWGSGTMGTTI